MSMSIRIEIGCFKSSHAAAVALRPRERFDYTKDRMAPLHSHSRLTDCTSGWQAREVPWLLALDRDGVADCACLPGRQIHARVGAPVAAARNRDMGVAKPPIAQAAIVPGRMLRLKTHIPSGETDRAFAARGFRKIGRANYRGLDRPLATIIGPRP